MKRTIIRSIPGICAAFAWWGFLYPQLTLTPDTFRIVSEDGTVQAEAEVLEWDSENNVYVEILSADKSRVRFRSRLLQSIAEQTERFHRGEK